MRYSVSTIKAAIELKQTFDQIATAEKSGSLSPDEKRKLEESAADKVYHQLIVALGHHSLFTFRPYTGYPSVI